MGGTDYPFCEAAVSSDAKPRIPFRHYTAPRPKRIRETEKQSATLLFGGATWKHERLMQAALERLGYAASPLPSVRHADLLAGKDYIDAGACCPTAFTAGSLVHHLGSIAGKLGRERTVREYYYVTAGGCGPCRFGQYQESYALALEGAGLPEFRVFLVDPYAVGNDRSGSGSFEMTLPFTLSLTWAFMCGDLLTELEYMVRPYEIVPGETDAVVHGSVDLLYDAFLDRPDIGGKARTMLWHLFSGHYRRALTEVLRRFSSIQVDRLRVKPKVEVTGEFWLQCHEGDGNYNIKRWLESEGAEVQPPAYTAWFDYLLRARRDRAWERRRRGPGSIKTAISLFAIAKLLRRTYDDMRASMSFLPSALPSQTELQRLAKPYFHHRLDGGEGYSLIGKTLHAYLHNTAHMVCELSPYGCLPNTMSAGAMAGVLRRHPDLLHAPIEIKGDAEVHALSRCQMGLTEAHKRARTEFEGALRRFRLTLETIRAFEAREPALRRADTRIPHRGYAGTAARYVAEVAARMRRR